jgi:hypothetical protein
MFKQVLNYLNCCYNPEINNTKATAIPEINHEKKNKLPFTIKPIIHHNIFFLSKEKIEKRRSSSILSKFSNNPIITYKRDKNKNFFEILNEKKDCELELDGEIFYNRIVNIDKFGLKTVNKSKKTGITVFGISHKLNDNYDKNNNIDFNLNLITNKNNISLFSVEYDKEEENYLLRLLNFEYNIFLCLKNNFLIKNNTTTEFLMGKILLTIKSPIDEKDNKFYVIIKEKKYEFDKFLNCPITIGRINSRINIDDISISKSHLTINYDYNNEVICVKDNNSSNGTFFIINDKCSYIYLLSDLNFKVLNSLFYIRIIYNKC